MDLSPNHPRTEFQPKECATEIDTEYFLFSKKQILKNFLVISFAWWIFFAAYDCLIMLQSTLNSENGIGVISVAVQFGGGILVSSFFPKYFMKKLGCKVALLISIMLHIPFIAANFYPHWIVMILSSIFVSAGNPMIWTALCAYLNGLSILYSEHIQTIVTEEKYSVVEDGYMCEINGENSCSSKENLNDVLELQQSNIDKAVGSEASSASKQGITNDEIMRKRKKLLKYDSSKVLDGITARFFGIHGMIYHSCHAFGNILAYYVLKINAADNSQVMNSTCVCGADFCNDQIGCLEGNLRVPSNEIRYTLMAVCIAFAAVSVIVIILFLDELKKKEKEVFLSLDLLMASFKLLKSWNFVFIIPMTIYIGVLQSFVTGDYTQAFVGCAWGIHNIALVLTMFSITLSLSSSVCGWFVKYLGRSPIFLFTAVLNLITSVLLLLWRPDVENPSMMFVVGGLLGFVIGTYWTQTRAFYGILFKEDEEAAFGSFQVWFCVGSSLGFGYSKYLCTSVKIYLLLIFSTLAILGYLVVEMSYSKSRKTNK